MKLINPFFDHKGPLNLKLILKEIKTTNNFNNKNIKINDIKDLSSANKKDITFLNSSKYADLASNTKASFCITTSKLENLIPNSCQSIFVENVLLAVAKITSLFYPNATEDNYDQELFTIEQKKIKKIHHGKNVLIGRKTKVGKNCLIGHNTIIENNVRIGDNCSIGSNVIIRKTIVGNNVRILDGSIIGKKGFGFFPQKKQNTRYPHIGMVIIMDHAEIGCGSTIDRGSMSNTIIGKNTFLDNQVHIAHNVKIGNNCMIAGQVGFAGSSIIGNNVMIGGQAGVSGHLTIGRNVKIGGGSGVVKNIPDNSKVMGYPAKDIRIFIKENK